MSLSSIADLMGETLVREQLRQALYQVAVSLPGAEQVESCRDQLGRIGIGVARVETMLRQRPGWRIELIFEKASLELLGSRQLLVDDEPGLAPAGALVGWTSYLNREIIDHLPDEAPAPVPRR